MAEGSGVDMSAAPGKTGKPQHCRMSVLGIDLSGTRAWVQLGACVAGVFACGVTHDFVQELVFRYDAFDFGWFMTLWELLIFVGAAWLQLAHEDRSHEIRAIRWREFVSLTIVLAITQGSGSVALSYVNFPVKVVMKSCKLIPTMVLGLLILRRSYSVLEYVAAAMLCVGVATFTLVDSKVSPKFDMIGIALLCLAVAGDAITVNLQEKILRHLQCSKEQMMFASNIMASGWVFLLIAVSGELMKALTLLYSLPEIAGISCARALVLT
jgi:adenosine 3'-phospho 5'-phosphosulfate transporter B3